MIQSICGTNNTVRRFGGLRTAVTAVLGRDRLRQLREVWRQAHTVDDTDADTMIELAWRWCRILGIDPTGTLSRPPPTTVSSPAP